MSQLNLDSIANQLGTGGPDFVGMPSVGGDPVVESGSNSDGEWARFADGTQHCWKINAVGSGAISPGARHNEPPAPYSKPFVSTPEGYVVLRGDYPDKLVGGVEESDTTTTQYAYAVSNNHGAGISNITHGAFFSGRWK